MTVNMLNKLYEFSRRKGLLKCTISEVIKAYRIYEIKMNR